MEEFLAQHKHHIKGDFEAHDQRLIWLDDGRVFGVGKWRVDDTWLHPTEPKSLFLSPFTHDEKTIHLFPIVDGWIRISASGHWYRLDVHEAEPRPGVIGPLGKTGPTGFFEKKDANGVRILPLTFEDLPLLKGEWWL